MTRPLAKTPLARPRATTAGLPPPSPDRQAVPASLRTAPERAGIERGTAGAELDRGRRLAHSDPQARYGNSEVARVALQQTPPAAPRRGIAPRTLPEAGPVAHGGHGKPSAHPGAARVAVEARHAGAKATKEADATSGRKTIGAARSGPAAQAGTAGGAGGKLRQREEAGTDAAPGGAAEDRSTASGAATGPAAVLVATPRRPALEGTSAIALAMPPLADAQRERVRLQTGLTIAEHYARTQAALDRLANRATSEQFAVVAHIELVESEVRRDLDNAAARIGPAVNDAIDRVRGACGTARAGITAASTSASRTIEANATEADRRVDATVMTSKEAVDKAVVAASPRVRALHEETLAPMRRMLAVQGAAFAARGKEKGAGLPAAGAALAIAMDRHGGALELAQAEKRQGVAADSMKSASEEFTDAGRRAEQDILAQEASLSLSFLMFVNPVAVKMEQVGGEDGKTVVAKGGEVRLRLSNDYERAKGAVEESSRRALKALVALEQSAVHQLRTMGRGLEAMAARRRDQLGAAILDGRAPVAEAWSRQMKGVNELAETGELVDWRRLDPRLSEAMATFDTLSTRQRLDVDAQARGGFDEARTGMDGDRGSLEEGADSFVKSAQDTRRQADAMGEIAGAFGRPFHGMAGATASAALEFRTHAEEKLGVALDETRKQMAALLATTEDSLKNKGLASFGKQLDEQIKAIEGNLTRLLKDVDHTVSEDLADRARRCYAAMDGVGTDETGLFEALHGMTPLYAKALDEYWDKAGHVHDLWWWLDDELSGDEYTTAYWYLKGDPVHGAAFEVKSSFHWYGDDVKQMESALRGLTPEQLKELGDNKKFADTRGKLEDSLKGTNLQVVQALLVGRTMRADALRLKEQIDAARAAGDDDKLHELLSKIDPRALPEMRTEFLDVAAGHAMTKEPLAASRDKAVLATDAAAFATYVTAPVEVWEPSTGEQGDGGRYVTRTLGADSARLATALSTTGEGSPGARAARLAFEVARGGKPRPEKLALALDDHELVKARANAALNNPDTKAPEYLEARQALDRLEARRSEVMTRFAEITSPDKSLPKDPARARIYTAQKVAGMFGDDDLGSELGTSMVVDGRAKPAVAIKYAVRGWGTNEALIRKTLRDMDAKEIADLKADYAQRFGGPDHDQDALYNDLGVFQNADTARAADVKAASGGGFFTELSGDERQEVEELLLGKPGNDRDRMRLARLKYAHQKGDGATWATGALMSQDDSMARDMGVPEKDRPPGAFAGKSLDMNKSMMEDMLAAGGGEEHAFDDEGNFKPSARYSSNDFRMRVAATGEMAENYKHHVDSVIGMITGAIAIIGAIIGTIVVTVLTLGTATPLVVGLWAAGIAAATGAATMATKYALKGDRYGWEEVAVDGALTLVDAATAGLTAGAGAKAARAATVQLAAIKAAARTTAQEAVLERIVEEQGRKELARGFVRTAAGAGVGGAARTATTDGTWDDGVLSGLGKTVHGGTEAAIIGLAAHGAGHGYSKTGLGKTLGQSTSYLRRGLGTGMGGAIGGMAGRGAELTLDALQGREHAPWDEVLGSIASAGGRGFAESVGQGMAEVPHARTEAAQSRGEALRRLQDDQRLTRFGTNAADERGDRQFRLGALAAALANDPRLDRRAFLAELDAGVARDRAFIEQNRQLARQFRREALASIPPARRGEFADLDIRVVPDADFEKFTGSHSGRAVTIIEDGEARIIVRRSATPETLREEGIHVLQSRDPQWRQRVAQLDEATLARWHDLDLETQLELYRNKIGIEVDAQRRLRHDLANEADGATDPVRRQALQRRAEDAGHTLGELLARRDEVEAIGPGRQAAIARGDEARPQYLREPARLFAKGRSVPELHPEKAARRAGPLMHSDEEVLTEPRRPIDLRNSTWEEEHARHRLYQVGDAWMEMKDDATGRNASGQRRRYFRMVEVTAMVGGVETVVDRRREILQRHGKRRWQQRGSESTAWGTLFEEASRQRTLATVREKLVRLRRLTGQPPGEDFRPDTDPLVPIGALRRRGDPNGKPLSAQHSGGAGLDDVVFRFRTVGGELFAEILVIEAKGHYRSLTLDDFSAIAHNLPTNLMELEAAVRSSDLPVERRDAVAEAIVSGRIKFEIHHGPRTGIGDLGAPRASILGDIVRTQAARRQLGVTLDRLLELRETTSLTPAQRKRVAADLQAIGGLQYRLERAYAAEPFRPSRVQATLRAILRDMDKLQSIVAIPEATPRIRRAPILDVKSAADVPHFEKARIRLDEGRRGFERSTGFALGLAERARWIAGPIEVLKPLDSSGTLSIVRSQNEHGAPTVLAVARPAVTDVANAPESAASKQLVELLRNGVAAHGIGTLTPQQVIWDAANANPAQIARVLGQVRGALASGNADASRLRVIVDGVVATDESALRRSLPLSDGVKARQLEREPLGTPTWILEFDSSWSRRPAGSR